MMTFAESYIEIQQRMPEVLILSRLSIHLIDVQWHCLTIFTALLHQEVP